MLSRGGRVSRRLCVCVCVLCECFVCWMVLCVCVYVCVCVQERKEGGFNSMSFTSFFSACPSEEEAPCEETERLCTTFPPSTQTGHAPERFEACKRKQKKANDENHLLLVMEQEMRSLVPTCVYVKETGKGTRRHPLLSLSLCKGSYTHSIQSWKGNTCKQTRYKVQLSIALTCRVCLNSLRH